MRDNSFKLKGDRFRSDTRMKFFIVMVVSHWNRLPGIICDHPSLEVFKAKLYGASQVSNFIWWKLSLAMAGDWD